MLEAWNGRVYAWLANDCFPSFDSQTEELYHVIEGQNETMAKLQDMLHRSQLGQLQVRPGKA